MPSKKSTINVPGGTGGVGNPKLASEEIADDTGGRSSHYPHVKLASGVEGEATVVSTSDPLPVHATLNTDEITQLLALMREMIFHMRLITGA